MNKKNFEKARRFAAMKDKIVTEVLGTPHHVCEIGVGLPKLCHVHNWIGKCLVTLIDANPQCCKRCVEVWGDAVQVRHFAIVNDDRTTVKLVGPGPIACGSNYVEGIDAPAKQMGDDKHWTPCLEVPACKFRKLDHGNFDYITIDIEGCELYVLQAMISRPKVIFAEMLLPRHYQNPNVHEICAWMQDNGYTRRELKEPIGSDWCWVRG